jgi:methionyl-tRNA formyltransferase
MSTPTSYTLSIAGSTSHTVQCAEALLNDGRFQINWILTPPPKPIGRKQVLTKNALHRFAEERNIPVLFVEKKIDSEVESKIKNFTQPDLLLVVDFGYLIPGWLLKWPKIAPLNVHPSDLPKWRGSSPGQFVLLFGEKESAVTLMVMGAGMDTGPLVWQKKFLVQPEWTQTEYYRFSFDLISRDLAEKISAFAEGILSPTPQPTDSPTPIARRLTKDDGFITWPTLKSALMGQSTENADASELLRQVFNQVGSWNTTIVNATRGLAPWPGVWTIVQTTKGGKRMKVLEVTLADQKIELLNVQIEGQEIASWDQVKSQVID